MKLYNELTLVPSFHTGEATLLEYSGFVTRPNESSLVPCEEDQSIQKTFIDTRDNEIRELIYIAYSGGNATSPQMTSIQSNLNSLIRTVCHAPTKASYIVFKKPLYYEHSGDQVSIICGMHHPVLSYTNIDTYHSDSEIFKTLTSGPDLSYLTL